MVEPMDFKKIISTKFHASLIHINITVHPTNKLTCAHHIRPSHSIER